MNPHLVAIFGGAVSGAEAAHQLALRGIRSVVFEQNALPFGKIEDGLPKWHARLRDKEEENINEKLNHPLVTYVPKVKLGREIDFLDIVHNWGFSAVFLATGAWQDRPLPVDGIENYIGKGFYYQNPFINWYNHFHETGYPGEQLEIADGAFVIGGGLASIDVVKALMMETVQKALEERGIAVTMFDLERSIVKVLEMHGLTLEALGLKGCTLVYRRRIKDMPLFPGDTDTPEQLAKAEAVREKVLLHAQAKFLFHMLPCHIPVGKIVENGRIAGLILRETRIENGRVVEVPGSDREVRTPLVIASIGSIPDPIPGIPMNGQTFEIAEDECCRLKGFDNVFALGNAVTGRGNIKESLEHGRSIAGSIADNYLQNPEEVISEQLREKEEIVSRNIASLLEKLAELPPPDEKQSRFIFQKIKSLHQQSGYSGDYARWIQEHLPVRLESLLEKHG